MDADAKQAIDQLRERVVELENRIDQLESDESVGGGNIDQYDARVIQEIEKRGEEPSPIEVVNLYKMAGVRDKKKIKDRHKFLKQTGRIEKAVREGADD